MTGCRPRVAPSPLLPARGARAASVMTRVVCCAMMSASAPSVRDRRQHDRAVVSRLNMLSRFDEASLRWRRSKRSTASIFGTNHRRLDVLLIYDSTCGTTKSRSEFLELARRLTCRAPVARKGRVQRQARWPMIYFSRRTVLTTGAAAAAASAAPQVFAGTAGRGGCGIAGRRRSRTFTRRGSVSSARARSVRLPAAGNARRRANSPSRLGAGGDQHPGGVQRRLPRDHHGPAQRQRRRFHRNRCWSTIPARVRGRSARRDQTISASTSSFSSATASAARSE